MKGVFTHSFEMNNTGQQKKCPSLKISYFPNFWTLISNPTIFFDIRFRFRSVASFAVVWSKFTFSQMFRNFEKNLNFSLLIWKGLKLLAVCKKKSFESDKRFESYHSLKLKNHKNFATFKNKKLILQ